MKLKNKILRHVLKYLEGIYGAKEVHAQFPDEFKKNKYPEPLPLGEGGPVPQAHLKIGVEEQWVILEVVPTVEDMANPDERARWKALSDARGEGKLVLITYKTFGDDSGEDLLRHAVREAHPHEPTGHIDILTFHRGRVAGELKGITIPEPEEEPIKAIRPKKIPPELLNIGEKLEAEERERLRKHEERMKKGTEGDG